MSGIPLPSQVSRSHAGVRAAKLGIKLKKSSRMQLQAVFPGVPYIQTCNIISTKNRNLFGCSITCYMIRDHFIKQGHISRNKVLPLTSWFPSPVKILSPSPRGCRDLCLEFPFSSWTQSCWSQGRCKALEAKLKGEANANYIILRSIYIRSSINPILGLSRLYMAGNRQQSNLCILFFHTIFAVLEIAYQDYHVCRVYLLIPMHCLTSTEV